MLRVRTIFSGAGGTPYLSTMFFDGDDGGEAVSAVSAVATFWGVIDGSMDSELTWATDPDVAIIDPGTGQTIGILPVTPSSGGGGTLDDALPFTTQGLLRWRTGAYANGREIRGRTFIPALTELSLNDGVMASTTRDIITGAGQGLVDDANSTLVVWGRTSGSTAPVVTANCWDQFAVLRSRRPEPV